MRAALAALPLLLLAACSGGGDADPGGLTPDQARQLDEAAAATDINASDNVTEAPK